MIDFAIEPYLDGPDFRAMKTLLIADGVQLRELVVADVDELYALVEANRGRLIKFMPWAAEQTPEKTAQFLEKAERQARDGDGVQAAITENGAIVGCVGVHAIDWDNFSTSVGYWIDQDHEGSGITRLAVQALCDHAFSELGLNRLEIRVAEKNGRSQRLAESLGFSREGLLREAEMVNGRALDCWVYSMLAREWSTRQERRVA